MRVALVRELGGIDRVELAELPDPAPAAGQVLVRVHGAGAGPWDVGFVSGGFPGLTLPFVPGQEIAGVVEEIGDGADLRPGERVYGVLFPAGEAFAAHGDRARLETQAHLVEAGTLRPQIEAVLPLEQAREALARVAGGHTRGKIVLQIGQ